ncbi:Protein arginine N-methyltransferase 3, partial [Bulinus truncatus]
FLNKSSWRYEKYDLSVKEGGKCHNKEAIGIVLQINPAETEDATLYSCSKCLFLDKASISNSVSLSVLLQHKVSYWYSSTQCFLLAQFNTMFLTGTAQHNVSYWHSSTQCFLLAQFNTRLTGQNLVAGSGGSEIDKNHVSSNTGLSEEDGYFASYGHHDIHMTMLKDKVRTEGYRDFMLKNPHLFEGKTVLDVGCGTGVLSMFAVTAGARHVVAVDQSSIIYQAMDIARENNIHEKITFVKGRLEDVNLPIEKFDVIISEWMGYFLLFEAMLDSVLWARDRYLKPDGCVYPDRFSMLIAGICDPDLQSSKLGFWDDVYGFKMSCMKSMVVDEVSVRLVKPETLITEPAVIKTIDLMNCRVESLDFSTQFCLTCTSDADMTALVGYFDTSFDAKCHTKVSFSTGPQAPPTHWEQAVMMFPRPIPVNKNSKLSCHMTYKKHPQDSRGIIILINIEGFKMKFSLS